MASYTLSGGFTTVGAHAVVASYAGGGSYAQGSATLGLTASANSGSIAMTSAPGTLTISAGGSGTEAITLVSSGFSGALTFKASLLSSTSATFPYCLSISPGTLSLGTNATQTATLTINTAATCASKTGTLLLSGNPNSAIGSDHNPTRRVPEALVILSAGLLGCFALRRRQFASLFVCGLVSLLAFGLSGCGSGGSTATTTTATTPPATTTTTTPTGNSAATTGTYSLRITAVSSANTSITANTTFTLVVN